MEEEPRRKKLATSDRERRSNRQMRGVTLAVLLRRKEPAQLACAACDAAAAQVCIGLDCEDTDEDACDTALRWALDALASGDAALAWRGLAAPLEAHFLDKRKRESEKNAFSASIKRPAQ